MNIKPYELTDNDLAILNRETPDRLAEIWCSLNRHGWDAVLGDEEPTKRTAEADGNYHLETTRRDGLMKWIAERIHPRLISRTWNAGLTDKEHADFWNKHGKEWCTY